jgi:cell wall-associated NlpC family hydrolase
MNRNKIIISVLLLTFSLLLFAGAWFIKKGTLEKPNDETNPIKDSAVSDYTTVPSIITTTSPVETTQETTEATTEATTMPTTEATTVPETTEAASADIGLKAAQVAAAQVGKTYQYGSAGPDAFDTSGLVQYCFKQCDISVPRSNSALAGYGYTVDKENIRPGDAVFFWSSTPGTPEYLGIYIGDGKVVAAFNSSKPVTQFDMNSTYYTEHFVCVRRFY